jgi:TetR/AcrR family transcriptional repressor of uid operon
MEISAGIPGVAVEGGISGPPDNANLPEQSSTEQALVLGSRARQRADTKERIFETALREFRDVGFAAAQIDRIAKNAGIARGTFYFHFPTKDDVMLELARRINARVVRRVALIVEAKPGLYEFLVRVNDAIIDEHLRVSEAGLHTEVLSLYIRRPYDLADPSHILPTLTDKLVGHLRALSEQRELHSDLTAEQLSVVIMSSLFGVLARMPPGEQVRATCISLIEILVKGLRSDG